MNDSSLCFYRLSLVDGRGSRIQTHDSFRYVLGVSVLSLSTAPWLLVSVLLRTVFTYVQLSHARAFVVFSQSRLLSSPQPALRSAVA